MQHSELAWSVLRISPKKKAHTAAIGLCFHTYGRVMEFWARNPTTASRIWFAFARTSCP
ncbi:Uncharacterised protein [Mycobacteroides abscessus subsp. abscessus]|nr:Uncharacterised protein [Mycobacteroides abscessus subsp. abscessus]SHZ09053.1 Uncharacterised protein [Mycobacteroides abscessus subsp. abscessus]